jgi:hypothetical protein
MAVYAVKSGTYRVKIYLSLPGRLSLVEQQMPDALRMHAGDGRGSPYC